MRYGTSGCVDNLLQDAESLEGVTFEAVKGSCYSNVKKAHHSRLYCIFYYFV